MTIIIIKEKGFQIEGAWEELGKHGEVCREGTQEGLERGKGRWKVACFYFNLKIIFLRKSESTGSRAFTSTSLVQFLWSKLK